MFRTAQTSYQKQAKGFTLIELLVVISIIALLIGILLPALGAARRTARQMQSNANVRSMHTAMVTFAQGNGERFPGLDTRGRIEPADTDEWEVVFGNTQEAQSGGHPATRYYKMLAAALFTGEIAISPADTKTIWTESLNQTDPDQIGPANYSYAMLRLQQDEAADDGQTAADANLPKYGRMANEWRDTINTEAPVISDRNTGDNTYGTDVDQNGAIQSIHTTEEGDWRGSVGWNDNHVTFETTHILRTKWTNGTTMVIESGNTQVAVDNLFSDYEAGGAQGSTPTPRASGNQAGGSGSTSALPAASTSGQAAMVYDDNITYTNHDNTKGD